MHEDASRMARLPWRIWKLVPVDSVRRVPDVAVVRFFSFSELRNGLAADHPDPAIMDQSVMQSSRAPRHRLVPVDMHPILAVDRVPDVEVIVPLIHITADNPH